MHSFYDKPHSFSRQLRLYCYPLLPYFQMVKDEIRLPIEGLFQAYQKNHLKEKPNIHIFSMAITS